MRRFLYFLFLFYLFYYFVRKALTGVSRKETPKNHSNYKEEDMVLDPSCNTYISKNTALTETRRGNVYYFCSEECRKRFMERV